MVIVTCITMLFRAYRETLSYNKCNCKSVKYLLHDL